MAEKKLVPLPDKRVTYKKGAHGTKYVYYTLRAYRNERGQPTSDEKSIGKLDQETGMLIPNKGYYEIFPEQRPAQRVVLVGLPRVVASLAERLKLTETLEHVFSTDRAHTILSLACYMLACGNVMMHYPEWAALHAQDEIAHLSSADISRVFGDITEEERCDFFERWAKPYASTEYIAYDVTSISSYSESMTMVEWGYNRDGDNLAQLNLGMYYGEASRLPLFYKVYSGSVVDKSYFPTMLAYSKALNLEHVRFVMDQGMLSQNNLQMLTDAGYSALSLLPKNLKLYKELLDEVLTNSFSMREYIQPAKLFGRSFEADYFGLPVKVYFYFNQDKAAMDVEALAAELTRKEEELTCLQGQKTFKPSQTKYFTIEMKGELEFDFEVDYAKVDHYKERLGYFALISTDLNLTTSEALKLYRHRYVIEKAFDQLKNGLDCRRLRTHQAQTTEGKVFVAFISLILRCAMMNLLKSDSDTENYTLKQAIAQLETIHVLQTEDEKHLLAMTKKQKDILRALDVEIG